MKLRKLRKWIDTRKPKTLFGRRIKKMANMLIKVAAVGAWYTKSFFYVPEKKLLYISISKAGNTSIKASLFAIPQKDDYREVQREVRSEMPHSPLKNVHKFEDYYKFTFVRNPFDRLVSCYENKMHSDSDKVGKSIKSLIYDVYLMGYLHKDEGFCKFAQKVCKISDKFADRHFVSQSAEMLDKNGELIPDFVGKFENFAADYRTLADRFDLSPLPHYNSTKKAKKNWMDYYDLETAEKVYKRYKKDIELFGYQESYDELIKYLKSKQA